MMNTVTRIILLMGICLLCCNGLWGCKGGREAKVGNIEGPDWIWETTSGYYKINYDGTGVTFHWSCDPPGAGHFEDPGVEFAKFIAGAVAVDTIVELRVLIEANEWGPVIKKRNITVKDITGWHVSEINGPLAIDENTSGIFNILAGGDTGITYEWSVDPPDAGIFEEPGTAGTKFTAGWVLFDTPAEIGVVVNSDNHAPVFKVLDITIINTSAFYVGEITGPDQVNENTSEIFSIIASGDSGITYSWTANPPDVGEFETPDAASGQYSAGDVEVDTPVELQVVIDSDNHEPVTRTKWITVTAESLFQWAKSWGNWGTDLAEDIAVDPAGNIYVTGEFHGDVDFDPGPGQQMGYSNGASDIFLGKYDTMGDLQWVRTWGGHYDDGGRSVAVDTSFGVYVTGYYRYSADFHPEWGEDMHFALGQEDAFLSKFDSSGDFRWARTWGGASNDNGEAVATGGLDQDCFVVGYFRDSVDFDPDEYTSSMQFSNGESDAFVTVFNSAGDYQWSQAVGGMDQDSAMGVVVDMLGYARVTGTFRDHVDFYPSGPGGEHTSNGGNDAFLFFPTGSTTHAYTWGGTGWDSANGITVSDDGNYYIIGFFTHNVDLDPTSGTDIHAGTGERDPFLISLDSSSNYRWGQSWGSTNSDFAESAAVDELGNIYVAGYMSGAMTLDTGYGPQVYDCAGMYDAYLLCFDSFGDPWWMGTWGSTGFDRGAGIGVDDGNNVYVSGSFSYTVDFNPTAGVMDLSSSGMYDAFLSKFAFDGFY